MPEVPIRKIAMLIEEIRHEGGPPPARPLRRAWVAAVILRKDLNAIIGTVLIISAMFLIVNVIVDLLIAFINPRIRYSQRAT